MRRGNDIQIPEAEPLNLALDLLPSDFPAAEDNDRFAISARTGKGGTVYAHKNAAGVVACTPSWVDGTGTDRPGLPFIVV